MAGNVVWSGDGVKPLVIDAEQWDHVHGPLDRCAPEEPVLKGPYGLPYRCERSCPDLLSYNCEGLENGLMDPTQSSSMASPPCRLT